MTIIITAILVIIGLLAGMASGIFGIGGGLIIVPALLIGLSIPAHTAVGTSLVALLLPVGIGISVYQYYMGGKLELKHFIYGAVICIGMIAGAFLGSRFALTLSEKTLQRCFAVFLVCMAALIWWRSGR